MPEPGDLVPCTTGGFMVWEPSHCPNGHQLIGGRNVVVGNYPCRCGDRHMEWFCREPGCGATVYGPKLGPDCGNIDGPSIGRDIQGSRHRPQTQ